MLKFLLGLILSVVGIPLLTLILLLDFSPDIPYEYYEVSTPDAIVEEEINRAIAGIEDGKLAISLSEENINKLIYNAILMAGEEEGSQINAAYAPGDTCESADCEFIMIEEVDINGEVGTFGVTGMWVEFYEDVISLNLSVKADIYTSFQTRIRLEFEVADNDDSYTVTYSKIRVGNIPLPKGVIKPIVNLILEQTGADTSGLSNELVEVDLNELQATVEKSALVEQLASDPGAQAGLNLIFDNRLVTIDVYEEPARLEVYVDVDKMTVDSEPLDLVDESFVMEDEITRQMNNILLSVFAGDPQIVINEETINALVASSMGELTASQLIPLGETELDIAVEGFWLELGETDLEANFQMRLNETHLLLELNLLAEQRNGNLVFMINEAYLGRDADESPTEYITIPAEDINALAGGFTMENDLFTLDMSIGELVILKDSISTMISSSSQGIVIDAITLEAGAIVIDITLPQQEEIQAVVAEVTEVLDTLEGGLDFVDDSKPEEVAFEEAVQGIADSIDLESGNVDIAPEDVEELVELYEELDPETQEAFIAMIEESVDQSVLEDFMNSFMN